VQKQNRGRTRARLWFSINNKEYEEKIIYPVLKGEKEGGESVHAQPGSIRRFLCRKRAEQLVTQIKNQGRRKQRGKGEKCLGARRARGLTARIHCTFCFKDGDRGQRQKTRAKRSNGRTWRCNRRGSRESERKRVVDVVTFREKNPRRGA